MAQPDALNLGGRTTWHPPAFRVDGGSAGLLPAAGRRGFFWAQPDYAAQVAAAAPALFADRPALPRASALVRGAAQDMPAGSALSAPRGVPLLQPRLPRDRRVLGELRALVRR